MTGDRLGSARGYTMVELLVVILIISILAAITTPLFIRQVQKGYEAQARSALRNVALLAEAYALDNDGSYRELDDEDAGVALADYGFRQPPWASKPPSRDGYLRFDDTTHTFFCIEVLHEHLHLDNPWRRATYSSTDSGPQADPDEC